MIHRHTALAAALLALAPHSWAAESPSNAELYEIIQAQQAQIEALNGSNSGSAASRIRTGRAKRHGCRACGRIVRFFLKGRHPGSGRPLVRKNSAQQLCRTVNGNVAGRLRKHAPNPGGPAGQGPPPLRSACARCAVPPAT